MMRALLLCFALLVAVPVWAVEPDEVLADPVLEDRAREISKNVRCVVCQNEPIDSSNAGVARDLRILIRERLVAGDSNAEVEAYLVARYGNYVLFKPPFEPATYLLWLAPFGLIALGGVASVLVFQRKRQGHGDALSDADEAEAARLLAAYASPSAPEDKAQPNSKEDNN